MQKSILQDILEEYIFNININMNFKILSYFLLRRFFSGVFVVIAVISSVIFLITFVERLSSNSSFLLTVSDSWIRLIEYLPLFLPLAVFIGTLLSSYNLIKSSESIIISNSGLSPFQSFIPFLIGSLIIGIITTTIINPYSVKLSTNNITNQNLRLIDNSIWIREESKDYILTLRSEKLNILEKNKLELNNNNIFIQDKNLRLTEIIKTNKLILENKEFKTNKAIIIDEKGIPTEQKWNRNTSLTFEIILNRYLKPDQISFWKLPAFIKKMNNIGIFVPQHVVHLWTLIFLPLNLVSMAFLGTAFSLTKQRRNYSFGLRFSLAILVCFILYFITNIFKTLGSTSILPAVISVLSPQLIIVAIAGIIISKFTILK